MARLFAAAFIAQWELLPQGHQFQRTALVAAAVAAGEAVYRQVSPQGEATILGWLAGVMQQLATLATPKPTTVIGRVDVTLTHASPAEIASHVTEQLQGATATQQPASAEHPWPTDAPTGPDGRPTSG